MEIIDRGGGPPLVLIPGLQGRWEYLRPAVDALSASFRVLTFSLDDTVRLKPDTTYGTGGVPPGTTCGTGGVPPGTTYGTGGVPPGTTCGTGGVPPGTTCGTGGVPPGTTCGTGGVPPGTAHGLDRYADQIASMLTVKGIERATICGVSFGGLIAVRFAATFPSRCDALILASTPRPSLRLRPRHQLYLRAPWIFGPIFLAETPFRLRPEIRAAIPDAKARRRFSLRVLRTVASAPVSLSQMAGRARMISSEDVAPDCARITAPTLVVTGERHLDHVVPVEGSSEYLRLIPNARAAVLERTGHLGSITRPDAFAAIVRAFTEGHRHAAA